MKKKIYRSEDIIIKDQPIEIIDEATKKLLSLKSLEAKKNKSGGVKLNMLKDEEGNVNIIEITCVCGEVIRVGLRYS